MIIQCQQCRTRFRFDESLIEGEGVWVRCSRCRHVFFQENPSAASGAAVVPEPAVQAPVEPVGQFHEARVSEFDGRGPLLDDSMDLLHRESSDEEAILDSVAIFRETLEEDRPATEDFEEPSEDEGAWPEESAEEIPEEGEETYEEIERRARRMPWKLLAWMTLIVVLIGGLYLFFFPEVGQQLWHQVSSLALFERIRPVAKQPEVGPAQVLLQDVRQRFVPNGLLGDVRVVEGVAVNGSQYPMTRVSIRAELYDAAGAVVRERSAYCGNLLSEQELATLTEEQMLQELSIPQGSDISNDRIEPEGQIPFMVVFAGEPPGVVKTMVVPAGAERLLQ